MHLLGMTNLDYLMMTSLFALLAVVSYLFRRKNKSSKDFLILDSFKTKKSLNLLSLVGIGLPEFLFFSSIAACWGLSSLYLTLPLFLILSLYFDRVSIQSSSITDLCQAKSSSLSQRGFYISYGLFLLLASGVVISILVGLLKSLLGWEFGNSTLALMAVVAICLLLGGVISTVYNHFFTTIILTVIMLVVIVIGYQYIGTGNLLSNLAQVAKNNQLSADAFILIPTTKHNFVYALILCLAIITVLLLSPLNLIKTNKMLALGAKKGNLSVRFGQVLLLSLVFLIGIFALATPNGNKQLTNSQMITQQTKLDDGSLGFIVRAVPSDKPTMQRGIIPQNVISDDSFTGKFSNQELTTSGFDYLSAALVLIKHSLPYAFVSLFVIIILFYKSMSESLSFVTLLTINGFYAPYYNKSGEEYENLWATRVFLFMYVFVAIAIGLVMYKYFDLTFLAGVLLLAAINPALSLCGLKTNWVVTILIWIIAILSLLTQNIENIPSLFPLVNYASWWNFIAIIGTILVSLQLCTSLFSVIGGKKQHG